MGEAREYQLPGLVPDLMRRSDMQDRTCSVDGCERPPRVFGMCKMHGARLKATGTVDLTGECIICAVAIPYKGKGRRQTLCSAEACRLAYNVRRSTEWRRRNPAEVAATRRRWREANPEKHERQRRSAHLRREYGLSLADYDRMVLEQGAACGICGEPQSTPMVVDHCHESNAVRGLLCAPCNLMIGIAKDRPDVLVAAANYLRRTVE